MENKRFDLEQFLKRLERYGDLGLAAQRAGVSNEQLNQWFNARQTNRRNPQSHYDPDILNKIALARYKGLMRKNLRAGLITPEQFAEVLRYCYNCSTKRGSRNATQR
jgi:SRSO17 transposase